MHIQNFELMSICKKNKRLYDIFILRPPQTMKFYRQLIDKNGCRKPLRYQMVTGSDGWCTSLLRISLEYLANLEKIELC